MKNVIAILGPTATGKTDLAIALCKKFNGEIISVDSRQAYKGMDIGTGKSFGDGSIPIHLYSLVAPNERLNAHMFAQRAMEKLEAIHSKNKVAFLVGGTGFYLDVILGRRVLSGIGADLKLRDTLESLSEEQLIGRLNSLDPQKLATIDTHNRYRLVRAIEIASAPKVVLQGHPLKNSRGGLMDVLIIGLMAENNHLYERSDKRINSMMKAGLLEEVGELVKEYGFEASGLKTLGYREFKPYFEGQLSLEEAVQKLKFNTHAYIRRQKTYFKKYFSDASWVDVGKPGFEEVTLNKVESFLG